MIFVTAAFARRGLTFNGMKWISTNVAAVGRRSVFRGHRDDHRGTGPGDEAMVMISIGIIHQEDCKRESQEILRQLWLSQG